MLGAISLLTLPFLAVEVLLGVDLKLVHVDRAVVQLHHRLDQPRMRAEAPEPIVIGVGGEGGTRHPRCLPPHLLAVHPEYRVGPTAQHPDLFGAERLWQEEVAFLMEPVDLVLVELHGVASLAWRRSEEHTSELQS